MSKPLIQIGDEIREMTDAEYTQWKADNETHAIKAAEAATKVSARESALNKLAALGLTEAEITAIIGA